ncbi:MAG: hypothetical protein J5U17_00180 [Candidatus Methanoperedens sp.]|nr:hypothetical protein [Candidatus Methanoperedens sp.]MCE8427038.1 hypothetical protein [Candidatus Methanoperedens sp.]
MVLKRYIKGILFIGLVLNLAMIAMAAPDLSNGEVFPRSGDTTTNFNFNVTFMDTANGTIADYVRIKLDGIDYPMTEKTSSDVNTSDGKIYVYTAIPLSIGTHYYNFTAKNGTYIVGPVQGSSFEVTAIAPNITSSNPASPVYTIVGNMQAFNVTVDQVSNVNWTIGSVVQTNESVPVGTKAEFTGNATAVGQYTVTATASNTNGSSSTTWTWNVTNAPDQSAPDSITNLSMAENGTSWITWTWTKPNNTDFAGVNVYLDGVLKPMVNESVYNATGLSPGTSHTISTHTVDTSGNINSTWVNLTNSTSPNTPTGQVTLTFSNLTISFSNVTVSGNTTVTTVSSPAAHPLFTEIGSFYRIDTTATSIGNITIGLSYSSLPSEYSGNDVRLYHFNGSWNDVTTNRDTSIVYGNVISFSTVVLGVPPKPSITRDPDTINFDSPVGKPATFKAKADQTTNITWKIDGVEVFANGSVPSGTYSVYTNSTASQGTYNISVTAINISNNLNDTEYWNWTVRPRNFASGNRIWDENKGMSRTYTWNPYSFSGFYYNINDNLGTENLTIMNIDRNIARSEMIYSTSPFEASFEYSDFGKYNVIGFMADKYFAGYTSNSIPSGGKVISTIGSSQLHQVLFDDKDKRTITEGGTLTLKDGYVLKMTAVDIGAGSGQIWVTLLKDGNEVDSDVIGINDTYIYTKKVGAVSDLPIIAVHFDTVFRGREVNAAFIKGIFQISESYNQVKSSDKYGIMKITKVGSDEIRMENDDSLDLSAGNTIDLMGNLKIKVADNSSVLRFGLTVENTGSFDVRGTIYNETSQWTPMNFGLDVGGTSIGFYYNIDDDIGNETLWIDGGDVSGTSLEDGKLKYSTTAQEVNFTHDSLGSYQVMGFMAEKYFAGYSSGSKPSNYRTISTIGSSQLHKVLIDNDDKSTITEGGTLTLKEGYVLKMTAVDIGAGSGQIWVTLLKDGSEIDQSVLASGQEYIYTKKVGRVSDLPILVVHFESVFRGREVNAAFIKGVFQISEIYTEVKSGNLYGAMKVTGTSNGIQMENDNTIDLSPNQVSDVMGNIKFRTADSNDLRFYPFVEVTQEMIANQLAIEAPANANAGDNATIKITAGGNNVENASVTFDSSDIGETNSNGEIVYAIPKTFKGIYNITATKVGFEKATKSIDVAMYIDYRLSIDAPAMANRLDTITIQVTYNGTPMSAASVNFDNSSIGESGNNGTLNYTLNSTGIHTISASKTKYITAAREIEIKELFSEFKALDINVTPAVASTGSNIVIRSNITNVGTKADTLPVNLLINETLVDNRSVTLAPGEIKEINFTRKGSRLYSDVKDNEPGNYSVEILGQKGMIEVLKDPVNYLLIGGLLTIFGIIAIYFLTAKNKLSLDQVKSKLSDIGQTIQEHIKNLRTKP